MSTRTRTVLEVSTYLTTDEIAQRVKEVEDYDRFSVFTFEIESEQHLLEVANAEGVTVTNRDGVYLGHVEDWDESHYYVNLR